jgi:SNF2 family DNA or RNA helicase
MVSREKNLKLFAHDSSTKVLIANIHAAGTAINLTNCNQVLMAESSWTPADNAQAIARCHRIGQKQPVFVRWVTLTDDPIDRKVSDIVKRKTKYIFMILV